MRSIGIIFIPLLIVCAGCRKNSTGSGYPDDADEILDYGIIYARYGDEWWSVQEGKRWNVVNIMLPAELILKSGNTASVFDFGGFRFYVSEITEPDENGGVWVSFNNQATQVIRLSSYGSAWSTEKYTEIRLACYAGCEVETVN